ncbi:hypothetical protein predicted by Glimmer/Critica [Sorangium cellulosum So ce56]|uniref:Uncharacterized protein n=1 Tax=Sorangium cellulosum (strain So ce56) TaxID=448385 RepID=A9FFC9_SORC5|nr:hypothetical protein predicted by Glimmer/Critica [Sorangium cellulosum So ce56]
MAAHQGAARGPGRSPWPPVALGRLPRRSARPGGGRAVGRGARRLVVTADVDVRPVRFGASVGALAPFMMVEALAGDAVVTSTGGPGVLAALGAGVVF